MLMRKIIFDITNTQHTKNVYIWLIMPERSMLLSNNQEIMKTITLRYTTGSQSSNCQNNLRMFWQKASSKENHRYRTRYSSRFPTYIVRNVSYIYSWSQKHSHIFHSLFKNTFWYTQKIMKMVLICYFDAVFFLQKSVTTKNCDRRLL